METPPVQFSQESKEKLSLNILFADDDELLIQMMPKLLASMGHKVTPVGNGTLLLEELRKQGNVFDLVISDNNMPKKKGIDALREMRLTPNLKDIPFILATTDDPSIAREVESLGGFFIKKPFNKDQLSVKIEEAVKRG